MPMKINCDYSVKEDLEFLMDSQGINVLELSEMTKISRTALNDVLNNKIPSNQTCEKLYSYIYNSGYRINKIKEELCKEKYQNILFHGSKYGLKEIYFNGSRSDCDFGNGFYLGETYRQALSFVCEKEGASVYVFKCDFDNLKIKRFSCDLEWMLVISYYRGLINDFKNNEIVSKTVSESENCDIIIAPIADNRMFYIMSQFASGEINADVALHSLAASFLGLQYIFKSEKAIRKLSVIDKYYLSLPEKENSHDALIERSLEIDTKLKLAKREFKKGLFIEEILK